MTWGKSAAEKAFLEEWLRSGLPGSDITSEFRWHPSRKWRFDYAFPSQKLAVEIEGRGFRGAAGRHHTISGAERDSEKYNSAVEFGWRVLRYQTSQLSSREKLRSAVEQVCRVLCGIIPDEVE